MITVEQWKNSNICRSLAAVLTVKFNMGDATCSNVSELLEENSELYRKIHTTQKYDFNN